MPLNQLLMPVVFVGLAVFATAPTSINGTNLTSDQLYEGLMCDSDSECEEATGYPYDTAMLGSAAPKYPRLVGIGCEGANGPIYAFEEDHFPVCREIFPMDWEWQERIAR